MMKSLKKHMHLILVLLCCLSLISCAHKDYNMVSCPYPLKQIQMYNNVGWALSAENEILYTENGVRNLELNKSLESIDKASEHFAHAVFVDAQTAYITYFSSDNENLVIEHTHDRGANWQQTLIKYTDYADAGSAYLSFSDDRNGFLLYCSTPALGQMAKYLFVTDDAGETFTFARDLTAAIAGYPQGITAVSKKQLDIAVTYHGVDNYLYQSADSGKTWEPVEIFSRSDERYIDGYKPIFYGADRQRGILILKVMREDAVYELYTTDNGGAHWTLDSVIPCGSLLDYSISDDNRIYIIDQAGKLYLSDTLFPTSLSVPAQNISFP